MGIGHRRKKQLSFTKTSWHHRLRHGGRLRNQRLGRTARPLSTKSAIHVVFKAEIKNLKLGLRSPRGFQTCTDILRKYSHRFYIKIESQAICGDHVHLVIRLKKRSLAQHFFRVVAGQIAQVFEKKGFLKLVTDTPNNKIKIWKYRPFTRVICGWKALQTAIAYVRLNEKEALGIIQYSKQRLKVLNSLEWELLWT